VKLVCLCPPLGVCAGSRCSLDSLRSQHFDNCAYRRPLLRVHTHTHTHTHAQHTHTHTNTLPRSQPNRCSLCLLTTCVNSATSPECQRSRLSCFTCLRGFAQTTRPLTSHSTSPSRRPMCARPSATERFLLQARNTGVSVLDTSLPPYLRTPFPLSIQ
jgi:hypothetical protein